MDPEPHSVGVGETCQQAPEKLLSPMRSDHHEQGRGADRGDAQDQQNQWPQELW